MTNQNNNHGGARPGSGRKKMDAGKKQKITFALSEDVIKFLRANRPAAQTLEKIVRDYAQSLEKAAAAAEELGNTWNTLQKITRIKREISHFTTQIERFSNPQNPREKAALTLSRRKLAQRQKTLDNL